MKPSPSDPLLHLEPFWARAAMAAMQRHGVSLNKYPIALSRYHSMHFESKYLKEL